MTSEGLLCWSCGKPTGIKLKVMRSDSCVDCMADLRCCRGCRHFDPVRRFQCKENIETNLQNKEKSNFCDFFQMRDAIKKPGGMAANPTESRDNKRQKFDDLFKD